MMEERGGEQGQVSGDTGMIDSADALQLDEARWDAVVATLPPLVRARARNGVRTRAFLEAVLWIAVTRQPWGRLPTAWGPWHSVYVRFTRWAQSGLWDEVIASLQAHADVADPLRRLVSDYLLSRHPASIARRAGPRFTPF
ncbi:transposase [Pseudoxanthomonas sp. LjRoot143]|uniref:transposase n=1 Tax=Pseudoxanthomonas sp. LjRoot143 TaxID=3342266 RepID=UPI003ECF3B3A